MFSVLFGLFVGGVGGVIAFVVWVVVGGGLVLIVIVCHVMRAGGGVCDVAVVRACVRCLRC